ncbi:Uncharacterised protein [uncultured Clostridium sp.]|nr:hypothetical protein [uncultured Clostridium sp.]SCK04404.1 Uncharacterised protein [uncultured Clostridium sp.]
MATVTIVEPNITPEENERNLQELIRVLEDAISIMTEDEILEMISK